MKSKVVIVLGMHRSGTSCLTGLMEEAGVYLGDVSKKDPFNKLGNQERKEIRLLQQEVLEFNDGDWDDPPNRPARWSDNQTERLRQLLEEFDNRPIWGFKDPRTVILIDQWQKLIPEIHLIGTLRNPLAVATSLNNRSGKPISDGVDLWYKYNSIVWELWQQHPFPIVDFDLRGQDYIESVRSAFNSLDLELNDEDISFFDDSLRTADKNLPDYIMPTKCKELYLKILKIVNK